MERKVTFGVKLYNADNMAIVMKGLESGVTIVKLADFFKTQETTTEVFEKAGFTVRWVYDRNIMDEAETREAIRALATQEV